MVFNWCSTGQCDRFLQCNWVIAYHYLAASLEVTSNNIYPLPKILGVAMTSMVDGT